MSSQLMSPWREKLHEIIYETDTAAGRRFDIWLLIFIIGSILVVILESVESLDEKYHQLFFIFEWTFTIIFTIEYILRLATVMRPIKYATSFFGIVDLLSIIPTYLTLILAGSQYFVIIRSIRLLRVFRILKLSNFMSEGDMIVKALRASKQKIMMFLFFVFVMVLIVGSVMYVIEGKAGSGFDSIPRSIYWAIVTLTTVGYGDISPITPFGQAMAAFIMILGYGVIAVPTGIVTSELSNVKKEDNNTQVCRSCVKEGHDKDAEFCKFCGVKL